MLCLPLKALNPGATPDPRRNLADYTLRGAVRASTNSCRMRIATVRKQRVISRVLTALSRS